MIWNEFDQHPETRTDPADRLIENTLDQFDTVFAAIERQPRFGSDLDIAIDLVWSKIGRIGKKQIPRTVSPRE